jgi:hypothetical protein
MQAPLISRPARIQEFSPIVLQFMPRYPNNKTNYSKRTDLINCFYTLFTRFFPACAWSL